MMILKKDNTMIFLMIIMRKNVQLNVVRSPKVTGATLQANNFYTSLIFTGSTITPLSIPHSAGIQVMHVMLEVQRQKKKKKGTRI